MDWIPFEKWEGLGNDFLVVRDTHLSTEDAARYAPHLCHRRHGVGGDGVLLLGSEPPSMIVINADGSRPEMCGNGIRCAAAAIARWTGAIPTAVDSDAGPRPLLVVDADADRTCVNVNIEMGTPSFRLEDAGVNAPELLATEKNGAPTVVSSDALGDGYVVSVGNPHWIFIGDEARDVTTFGPAHETDARFTRRTNVEWVTPVNAKENHFRVDVWERGSGRTLACGTGATAVAFLLVHLGHARADAPVRITLPGGDLLIRVEDDGTAWMQGPAKLAFEGRVALPAEG